MKDYYALLGLERGATKADIKRNYRTLAIKYHPDKSGDDSSAEKFIAITEAYDVLSNKNRRAAYDLYRWQEKKQEKKRTEDSFTVGPTYYESPRARRRKEQQRRSVKFHQEKNDTKKWLLLILEGFVIVSRYTLHIVGLTLLILFFSSLLTYLQEAFNIALLRGIILTLVGIAMVYGMYNIIAHFIAEYQKDLVEFSTYFKVKQRRVSLITYGVLTIVFLFYMGLLVNFA